jgi:YidC/Oxa1 family membrane protein insertase
LLSLAIIFGYDYLLKELGWSPQQTTTADSAPSAHADMPATSTGDGERAPSTASSPKNFSASQVPVDDERKNFATTAPLTEEVIEVETSLYRAKWTTRGAVLTSWELKQYRGSSAEQPAVQLVRQDRKFPGPLAILPTETAIAKNVSEGLFAVERDFSKLDQAHPVGHITFRYEDAASHLQLEKQLTFHADSYLVDVAVKTNGIDGSVTVVLGTNFGIVEWGDGLIGLIGSASLIDGKVEKETPGSEAERKGTVQWTALQDKYFLSVLIPKQGSAVLVKKEGDKVVSTSVRMPVSPSGSTLDLQLYAGPKEYDTLRALQIGLEDTIDFGWLIF